MTNTVPDTLPDELRVKGVLSKGYGQLAKIVMLDPLLTLESKAIYAYFCSYCGGGTNTAFPGRDKMRAFPSGFPMWIWRASARP